MKRISDMEFKKIKSRYIVKEKCTPHKKKNIVNIDTIIYVHSSIIKLVSVY